MFSHDTKFSPFIAFLISAVVASFDQAVKWMVQQSMTYGESILVTPFFGWLHTWNTGAAFGLLANAGGWQRYFLSAVAIAVSIILTRLIYDTRSRGESIAYSLVLGGAASNVIDRIFRGHVIDYLDFFWRSWHWPAFNLADVAIVCGVLSIISLGLLRGTTHGASKPVERIDTE